MKKRKTISQRLLALALCLLCLLAAMPIAALADDGTEPTAFTETVELPPESSEASEPASEPSEPTDEPDQQPSEPDEPTEAVTEPSDPSHNGDCVDGCTVEGCPCACHLTPTEPPAETTEPTGEPEATEETEIPEETTVLTEPEDPVDPVQELYDRLMECTTLEEINAILYPETEEEQAAVDALIEQFTEEQNAALEAKLEELGAYGVGTLDVTESVTIEAGSTGYVTFDNVDLGRNINWSCSPSASITAATNTSGGGMGSGSRTTTVTISVSESVNEGDYTLSYTKQEYSYNGHYSSTKYIITVTVKAQSGTVPVYVYVSATSNGESWVDNEEFKDLIGLYVCDTNNDHYFPAGVIQIDKSYFTNKSNKDTSGAALINSSSDWTTLMAALHGMDTSTLNGTFRIDYNHVSPGKTANYSSNRGNHVADYLDQACQDVGAGWGSGQTALFRWYKGGQDGWEDHTGFDDQTVKYHLDLRFTLNKITFITGNNGITTGQAKDGTTVDSRVYITGSEIQEPRNLYIPDGYQFMGYYKDANFTQPWDGIGTPLNSDQTVYIKITEKDNIVLNYVVAEGQGTVSPENEAFNPDTGNPTGSTATAADGWTFDGWYADKECTIKLSSDAKYVPTKPESGWVNSTTYYAKFVQANITLTIKKLVDGNMASHNDSFTFTVTKDGEQIDTFTLKHNGTREIQLSVGDTITVTENIGNYTSASYEITATGADKVTGNNNSVTYTVTNAADQTITFTNTYNVTISTGISLETLPYILILAVVAVGAVVMVRKRRSRDED